MSNVQTIATDQQEACYNGHGQTTGTITDKYGTQALKGKIKGKELVL